MGHRGYVRYIHVECDRLGAPTVNHIYYVHLRWGYVDSGMGGLVGWGIWWGVWRLVINVKAVVIKPDGDGCQSNIRIIPKLLQD